LLRAHRALTELPLGERRAAVTAEGGAERLAEAGVTWEALAGWLQGPLDKEAWEAVIPSMGAMALVRNLRNFDRAGVSDEVAAEVARRISDPAEVARSRQLPFRYLSAYRPPRRCGGHTRWSRPSATRWPTCPRCPRGRWCWWTGPARCSTAGSRTARS
jgi:hypothetical protein